MTLLSRNLILQFSLNQAQIEVDHKQATDLLMHRLRHQMHCASAFQIVFSTPLCICHDIASPNTMIHEVATQFVTWSLQQLWSINMDMYILSRFALLF
jgi:hypothetical protein